MAKKQSTKSSKAVKKVAKPVKAASKNKKTVSVSASAPIQLKKAPTVKERLKKSAIITILSDMTGLSKKQADLAVSGLIELMKASLKKGAVGEFILPGYLKMAVVRKPAVKAKEGVNPFTGEKTVFKARPARNVVKVRVLKKLKDEVA